MSNKALVINGRLHTITRWNHDPPVGIFTARDSITGELGTYDWFTNDIVDPNKNPEAFLIALSKIKR